MAIITSAATMTGGSLDDFLLGGSAGGVNNVINAGAGNDVIYGDTNVGITSATAGGSSTANAWNMTSNSALWSKMANPDVASATSTPWASAAIEGEGEFNYFRFDMAAAQKLTIDVDYATSAFGNTDVDLTVEIIASNGTTVLLTDTTGATTEGGKGSTSTLDPYVTYTVPSTGTYYVRVSANGAVIPVGSSYVINFSLTGQAFSAPTSGDDAIQGQAGNDMIYGGGGNDEIYGGDNVDTIYGGSGNDILYGGLYKDSISGGEGNDTFVVDYENEYGENINGDSGNDTLDMSTTSGAAFGMTVNLAANNAQYTTNNYGADGTYSVISVENVSGTQVADVIIGSTAANTLNGNAGNDSINGGEGNDEIDGGSGNDTMVGANGNDLYVVNATGDTVTETSTGGSADVVSTSVSYTLATGVYVETLQTTFAAGTTLLNLTGNALKQTIIGNAAANILDSATGAGDLLRGLAGADTYRIRNASDVIDENSSGGSADTVQAAVSFVLASDDHIETLSTINSAATTAINLTGNGLNQTLIGNAGNNVLDAKTGNDTMTGGDGEDVFVFSTTAGSTNRDAITDFVVVDDTMRLEDTAFAGLVVGALSAAAFASTADGRATDASDRIIYNATTGDLYFDKDGTGANTAVRFAMLDAGLALTNADFAIV